MKRLATLLLPLLLTGACSNPKNLPASFQELELTFSNAASLGPNGFSTSLGVDLDTHLVSARSFDFEGIVLCEGTRPLSEAEANSLRELVQAATFEPDDTEGSPGSAGHSVSIDETSYKIKATGGGGFVLTSGACELLEFLETLFPVEITGDCQGITQLFSCS